MPTLSSVPESSKNPLDILFPKPEVLSHSANELLMFYKLSSIPYMDNEESAWETLAALGEECKKLGLYTKEFSRLWMCAHTEIWKRWMYPHSKQKESRSYPLFPEVLPSLIPNATIVHIQMLPSYKPDFFVKVGEKICPVEIKPSGITISHRNQLERYMNAYKMPQGYIVGHALRCRLKKGMIFCKWNPFDIDTQTEPHIVEGR